MYIYDDLVKRADRPVQVGLIGAGKFGSMFLSQVPTTAGLEVKAIADLDPDRAIQACRNVGWSEQLIKRTEFFDSTQNMIDSGGIDVLVEATGNPLAGIAHSKMAIASKTHIVMVNVEADVLAGGILAKEAREAGIVYSCTCPTFMHYHVCKHVLAYGMHCKNVKVPTKFSTKPMGKRKAPAGKRNAPAVECKAPAADLPAVHPLELAQAQHAQAMLDLLAGASLRKRLRALEVDK